jgi:type I restriction enzyme S subunit
MELKPGYKQTEVGVIPEDWELESLEQLSAFITKGATPTTYGFKWESQGVLFLRSECVSENGLDLSQSMYISAAAHSVLRRSQVCDGDLLITITGNVGRVIFLKGVGIANLNQHIARVRVSAANVDARFVYYFLSQPSVRQHFGSITTGQAYPQISLKQVREAQVPLPPTLPEQSAIADALSDADALIESLEQLIAKKRVVKQGTMQELLRPKDGWKPTNIGNVADPNQRWGFTGGPFGSNLKSSDYTDEGVRIIQLQNIGDGEFKEDYELYTSTKKADELLSCNIYPGDILLSKMGDPVARACIIPPIRERYLMCSDGIRLAVNQRRFNTYFIYTMINAPDFRTKAANAGTGSTRKRIGLTELRNLELYCPDLPEQTAIAAVLSDMDAEIDALEAKLAKARLVKQGMMQELLTGRVRLV